jgi:hypothetical protein
MNHNGKRDHGLPRRSARGTQSIDLDSTWVEPLGSPEFAEFVISFVAAFWFTYPFPQPLLDGERGT